MMQYTAVAPRAVHPHVQLLEDVGTLRDPVLVAAFAGAYGTSAAATLAYLVEQREARPFAEIDPDEYYDFTVQRPNVRLEDGRRVIDWPQNRFFVIRPEEGEQDLVLFVGIEPHLRWRSFAQAVASFVEELGIREAYVLSAFRGPVPHTRPASVRVFTEDERCAARFGVAPRTSDYGGPVGIGSVLTEELRASGLRVASVSVLAPFYVSLEPEPHAVLALLDALDRGFGLRTPRETLLEQRRAVDGQAQHALARSEGFRQFLQQLEQQYDQPPPVAVQGRADTEQLMSEIEAFLRGDYDRGVSGPGKASRGR